MRAAAGAASALLSGKQLDIFERTTGTTVSHLVDEVLELPAATLSKVLDLGGGELGNGVAHPLNAKGLHVLRWLLARAIVDDRREQNGWGEHAKYTQFLRDGLLVQKLEQWKGGDRHVPLTVAETELIALAAGQANNPYVCANDGNTSGLAVRGSHTHTFADDDDQYQLHVDVYSPNIKCMVFTETVVAENGPFHFVRGSHLASAAKARWLFDRTRHATEGKMGGAFRHVNLSNARPTGGWCTASSACLQESYDWQQRDLARSFGFPLPMPVVVEAGTLVVGDTSAFHFRGIGVAGHRRARMGNLIFACRGKPMTPLGHLVNVKRSPVLACANGSAVTAACDIFHVKPPKRADQHAARGRQEIGVEPVQLLSRSTAARGPEETSHRRLLPMRVSQTGDPKQCAGTCVQARADSSLHFSFCTYLNKELLALRRHGIWEPDVTRTFVQALKASPGSQVIDVGARTGWFTTVAAVAGHNVLAIEPNARSSCFAERNAAVN